MTRPIRKAVIPAAGLGTRFLPATKAQPKEMLPVIDKPAIQHVVEEAVRAGLTDILLITGRGKGALEDHFDRSVELELYLERAGKLDMLEQVRAVGALADIHYVRQSEPLGLGHAVGTARQHVGDEPFVVMLADEFMSESASVLPQMIAVHERYGGSVVALLDVPRSEISRYGCAEVEPVEDQVVRIDSLVEKPAADEAPSTLAVVGRYVFTPQIFEALDRITPGSGGELQLTDAMSLLLGEQPLHGFLLDEGRFDVGDKLEWLQATVELAVERDDLGPAFREFLVDLVQRKKLL